MSPTGSRTSPVGPRAAFGVLLLLAATVGPRPPGLASVAVAADAPAPPAGATLDVGAALRAARAAHGVPGMAAVVVRGDAVVAAATDGVRRAGADATVTLDDRWHLGSCTKSMTATLCALLVEQKLLAWDSRVRAAFPEVRGAAAGWADVSLADLLVHRGGVPSDLAPSGLWARLWAHGGTPRAARDLLAAGVLASAPLSAPGTTFLYSNAGTALAGAMAERAATSDYEALLVQRLFTPLGITTAGFGAPGTPGALDAPWGHRADGTPVPPGPAADNPPAITPAGRVHMTIGDWGKYVALHLQAARGAPRLLTAATFTRLHTPPEGADYAMGWARAHRAWAGDTPVLTHTGSNTVWFAVTWLAPDRDLAVLVAANRGGDGAAKACDDVAAALIGAALGPR